FETSPPRCRILLCQSPYRLATILFFVPNSHRAQGSAAFCSQSSGILRSAVFPSLADHSANLNSPERGFRYCSRSRDTLPKRPSIFSYLFTFYLYKVLPERCKGALSLCPIRCPAPHRQKPLLFHWRPGLGCVLRRRSKHGVYS